MPTKRKLEGKSFLAALLGGETYFHWMTDVMPILLQERGRNKNFDGYDYILTHQQLKSFHQETFHKLGIPETKILPLTKKTQYLCRELGFHSPHHDTGRPPAHSLRRVAKFFRPRMTTDEGRKIALLRPAGSSRQLLHRQQILELLLSHGFQEYEPSQDTIEDQAKVFGSAKVIVAAHGAALTNLIFARPGTTVVELFSARYVNPCYMHICAQLGLKHIPVVDESVPDGVVYGLMNATVPILTTPQQVRSLL
jgi:capsular polysaccharide biosynthesis protein